MGSGPVEAGRYGVTLYNYPASGTVADRVAVLGHTSGAVGHIGVDLQNVLKGPTARTYTNDPVLLDGTDHIRTVFRSNVITIPVVVRRTSEMDALVEWRRIIGAFSAKHQRAALEVWDPALVGQQARWLPSLILRGVADVPLRQHDHDKFVGRLQFETVGSPFWVPEPIEANRVTFTQDIDASNTNYRLAVTNPGDQGTWPRFEMIQFGLAATDNTVTFTQVETGKTVVFTGFGTGGDKTFDFDRRARARDEDGNVTAGSVLFEIPPGTSNIDMSTSNPVATFTRVDVSFLPQNSTI